ncbi:MAG: hypothetical protein KGL95_07005, partial [Patescibacteria group bacterium]|nr:hypothetical protein [Patescibacteria group bacterium]
MKKIVSGVPLSYLLYQSPLVVDVDDQEMDWRRTPIQYYGGNGDSGASACECSIYNLNISTYETTPTEQEKICNKCVFTAGASFIRGVKNSNCQNSQDNLNYPACGPSQVDLFCSCGGFAQECAQTSDTCDYWQNTILTNPGDFGPGGCGNSFPVDPDITNLGDTPCMCFPYNQADYENTGTNRINEFHSINLKQGGMHQTNAHNYIDDLCSNGQPLLSDDESVLNFNNHALAACRKMAYFISNNQGIEYSQIEPFVKLNGICSQYLNTIGCGNQPSFISSSTGGPLDGLKNCPIDQECWESSFNRAEMYDINKCLNQIKYAE